jgi:endo-1,4-beta-xylanase
MEAKVIFRVVSMFLLIVCSWPYPVQSQGEREQPLRWHADRARFLVGAAVDMNALAKDRAYADLLAREVNAVVAENVMKPESLQPSEGSFDYSVADRLVAFARKHGMRVRGHTLVWHAQLPKWMNESRCKDAELLMRRHIQTVVRHFKGKIVAWDVVNEGIDDADGVGLRQTFWYRCVGPDYIEKAFQWAHAADPSAKLFYNDYGIEQDGDKSEAVYALVKSLKEKGVPIHGVGLQTHLDGPISAIFLERYMKRLTDLGLEVQITEMDVRLKLPPSRGSLERQAAAYGTVLSVCLANPRCSAFVMWGITDRYSWVPYSFEGHGEALIFDASLKPKAAHAAMLAAFKQKRPAR